MWVTVVFSFFKSFFSVERLSKWASFVSVHWKELALALLVSLFLYQMFSPYQFFFGLDTVPSLNNQIINLEDKLKASEQNFKVCKAGNIKLASAIDKQNDKIREWGEIASKIDKSTDELKRKIDLSRSQSRNDVKAILSEPTPQNCSEAMDYLRRSMGELKWSKPR